MDGTRKDDNDQEAAWNGAAGRAWVDGQELLDEAFAGFVPLLVDAVDPGAAVLDVGCGTGATSVALAARAGRVVGVDVSGPMLDRARERAGAATFVRADAATYPFAAASFDAVVSRFGVMFFADPPAAFANLRRATRPGGILRCLTWRAPEENPFMAAGARAVARWMGPEADARPAATGQFGLADGDLARRIVEDAGWGDVAVRPVDVRCGFDAADLPFYATQLGQVGRALRGRDTATRERIGTAALAAHDPWVIGDRVEFVAACWMLEARAPDVG